LKDECLVYLIREAALAEDSQRYSTLMTFLLKRCTRGIEGRLRALGVADDDVADVYGDIILAMMSAILAADGRGEFYQVRFRRALRLQLLKSYDRYALRQRRARRERQLDAPVGASDDGEEDAGTLAEVLESPEAVADDTERRLLISEALGAIRDPRHREAFVLHHFHDWPIETINPGDPSISQRFDRTPRMVRNWLRTADRELAAWRAAKRVQA
jgi:DNA-directed RNA polymerase specialized sigma24 family protein